MGALFGKLGRKSSSSSSKESKEAEQITSINDCPSLGMQVTLNFVETKFSDISHSPTHELHDKLTTDLNKSNVVVLDIREEKEFNTSHIPNAIWISPKLS
eukprot:324421_1